MLRRGFLTLVVMLAAAAASPAAQSTDISGKWTASFDTQIGEQTYTYEFVVKGGELTGTARSNLGEATLSKGRVDGNKVTFTELLKMQDMEIEITYSGTIASADEIKFTRQVGEFATEELVAKRAK